MTFNPGVFLKNIFVEIKADDVPELEAVYTLSILSVDGGADLSSSASNVTFKIRLEGIVSSFLFLKLFCRFCLDLWHCVIVMYGTLILLNIVFF